MKTLPIALTIKLGMILIFSSTWSNLVVTRVYSSVRTSTTKPLPQTTQIQASDEGEFHLISRSFPSSDQHEFLVPGTPPFVPDICNEDKRFVSEHLLIRKLYLDDRWTRALWNLELKAAIQLNNLIDEDEGKSAHVRCSQVRVELVASQPGVKGQKRFCNVIAIDKDKKSHDGKLKCLS